MVCCIGLKQASPNLCWKRQKLLYLRSQINQTRKRGAWRKRGARHLSISLEEILQQRGMGRKMKGFQYGKAFRQQMTQVGANDMIQGRGRKL